ncbi:uncharacterized protein LOC124450266 [Xenia sp. Carnegie-2017]|uniref:uncharacterized protein LOC124450266 n=1 Tax=Xenia sp. Carnegie-2017 TaxID=2897299 RepID=UPI001F04D1B3|nr:uncharacterized protein LOC124450266 [Xenia sp. Carnegie-2017]
MTDPKAILKKSLKWSETVTYLSNLQDDNKLPLIVQATENFSDEETSIKEGQILVLHELHSAFYLHGVDDHNKRVRVALSYSTPAYVCPVKEKYGLCDVEGLKKIFPKFQYIRVHDCAGDSGNEALKKGEILQIKKIKKTKKIVLCQHMSTSTDVTLKFTDPMKFMPLKDHQAFTLSEIVDKYGLPVRVCFEDASMEVYKKSNGDLHYLTGVRLDRQIMETLILATTKDDDGCLGLPTNMSTPFTIAEASLQNVRANKNIMKQLQAEFQTKTLEEKICVYTLYAPIFRYGWSKNEGTTNTLRREPENTTEVNDATAVENESHYVDMRRGSGPNNLYVNTFNGARCPLSFDYGNIPKTFSHLQTRSERETYNASTGRDVLHKPSINNNDDYEEVRPRIMFGGNAGRDMKRGRSYENVLILNHGNMYNKQGQNFKGNGGSPRLKLARSYENVNRLNSSKTLPYEYFAPYARRKPGNSYENITPLIRKTHMKSNGEIV